MIFPPDRRLDFYVAAANQRASHAFRPATQKNHKYVMKLFVGFALAVRLDHRNPTLILLKAFIEHLARTQHTAASVLSTVSTLRALLHRSRIPTHNFLHNDVQMLLRAIKINKRTPAVQKPPVQVHDLRRIIHQLQRMEYAQQLKTAVLLLFTTAFRQSNLAPTTARSFDHTRHLTRADVRLSSALVQVFEKWSKTKQQIVTDRWLSVPRVVGSSLCLHAAISQMLCTSPTLSRRQPLLVFDDGSPMPLSYINKCFKIALKGAGLSHSGLTLHSLRRGGARFLQIAGVGSSDIASHAGWKSAAMFRYIDNPTKPAAFRALQALK